MTLQSGVRVGRYEIAAALGAGGMGEVYRARDTQLHRMVAIKFLPPGLSDDPRRRERFEREAQAISSLNHPHICTLYDVGRHEGADYLVMELLEGQTLAERIRTGPLPLDQAIRCGIQIADGLDAAHRRGLVHRDLKPANVFLARNSGPSGPPIAKLLDFGIAKAIDRDSTPNSEQLTLTEEGTLLGTVQYMAPEQLEGLGADPRSDLFAFGAVLYEMLTGRRAFDGESRSKTIAAVLDSEPLPLLRLQPLTPPVLEHLVMTCLAKNPDERWQSAADVKRQLGWIHSTARTGAVPGAVMRSSAGALGRRIAIVAACFVALAAASVLIWLWQRQINEQVPRETRLEIPTPPTAQPWSFAISPDGLTVAFAAESEGEPALWVRPLNATAARPLRGTSGASHPFWSPDSQSIGFFADGKLKRIDLSGGAPQSLADALQPHGGAWSRNGTIIFAPHQLSPLLQVSDDGGVPSAVTQLAPGHGGHMSPRFLPDGVHVLYFVDAAARDTRGAYIGRLDGTPPRKLLSVTEPAEYASTGHLLFVRDNELFGQAFDLARLELKGSAVRIADRVAARSGLAAISTSNTGDILYRGAGIASGSQLTWYNRSGEPVMRVGAADPLRVQDPLARAFSVSPDGQRVALCRTVDGNVDVWLIDLTRNGARMRLTLDPAADQVPLWSRDGMHLTFGTGRNGQLDLYQRSLGDKTDKSLLVTPHHKVPVDWAPDGRVLLYLDADPTTHLDVWAMPVGGEEKSFPVVQSRYEDLNAQFSPNGKWIAYQSNVSGRYEVYVEPFGEKGPPVAISTNGGTQPRWRRDGTELFYLGLDGKLMAVPIAYSSNGRSVEVGIPANLFQTKIGGPGLYQREYEVSKNGQQFLMDVPVEDVPAPIIVIQNWGP